MAVCDVILQSDFQKRQTIYDGPKIAQMQHYDICDLFYICNAMHFWIKGYNMREKNKFNSKVCGNFFKEICIFM